MVRTAFIAALAALLPCAAQAQTMTETAQVVTSIQMQDLRDIISELGHEETDADEATVAIAAISNNGLEYIIRGTACRNGKCQGINMMVSYDANNEIDSDLVNDANLNYAAVSTWTNDGSLGISRYVILDNGMTPENISMNLLTVLAIAPKIRDIIFPETASSDYETGSEIRYGDDSGTDALDGACDDGRFHSDGDDYDYTRAHVTKDATDCRAAVLSGEKSLTLDFGDNSGSYADDGTCDDRRFTGSGRSILATDSHIKKDAADCIAAYQAGTINRP